MSIQDIMTRGIETVDPDTTLQSAAEAMKTLDVGFLAVRGEGKVAGLLTDRDIVTRAVADGLDPATTTVEKIMTPRIWTISADASRGDAAELMKDKSVRRLIVVDQRKRAIGVLSLGDLASSAGDDRETGEILHEISEPAHPAR